MPWTCLRLFCVILPVTVVKCSSRSFENIDDSLIDGGAFDRTRVIRDLIAIILIECGTNHLFCITDHCKIGIMRHQNDLTAFFSLLHARHQEIYDCLIVEILFRLVDHKWDITFVNQQIEHE